jgi:hypothetical protein
LRRSIGLVALVRAEGDSGQATEAEHPDAEPDEPQAGECGRRERSAAEPLASAIIVGDEDLAVG